MRGPSPWLILVVLLLGIILVREPRFAAAEEVYLGWLVKYTDNGGAPVPLTVVEIGSDALAGPSTGAGATTPTPPPSAALAPAGGGISPLEFALYLQSVLEFQPGVAAFENVLKWRERDKDQEQIFLDQAMRVPKLLLASELGTNGDPDAPWAEIRGFRDVTGKRGDLAAFPGVTRQPNEDLRLISSAGYVNLPEEISSKIRVPLLFLYRGEVIPAFALQAILLWEKVTPAEVKIVLGSHIALPRGQKIPIRSDGTLLIQPNAASRARHLTLNELLLAAQQRESGNAGELADMKDQIVLARTPAHLLSPPDVLAAAIATIQSGKYLRRISPLFDYGILVFLAVVAGWFHRIERFDLVLCGIAATAAYCLIALGTISRWNVWLPGILPLGAIWIAILLSPFFRTKADPTISIPPPIA
ncbi:MAG: hypothetical protein ABI992_03620 [Chthoniobacterales bacterium]